MMTAEILVRAVSYTHLDVYKRQPERGLTKAVEQETKDRLLAYKEKLSREELQGIIENTKNLKLYQDTPSTKEELEKIPMLKLEDIEKKAEPLYNKESEYDLSLIHI